MSSDPTRVAVVLKDPEQKPRFLSINDPENVVRPPWTANPNELIGRGEYGSVYKGITDDGRECAVKMIDFNDKVFVDLEQLAAVLKLSFDFESNLTELVSHFPLTRCYGCDVLSGSLVSMAYELFDDNLNTFVQKQGGRNALVTLQYLKERIDIAKQAANALAFVHSKGWIHKDVKPSNFVIHYQLPYSNPTEQIIVCKLTDVGVTTRLDIPTMYSKVPLMERTLTWTATEMLANDDIHRPATDVWSFACVLYFLFLGGIHPFENEDDEIKVYENIIKGQLAWEMMMLMNRISNSKHFRLSELIRKILLIKHPNKRPTMSEVVADISQWVPYQPKNMQSINESYAYFKKWKRAIVWLKWIGLFCSVTGLIVTIVILAT